MEVSDRRPSRNREEKRRNVESSSMLPPRSSKKGNKQNTIVSMYDQSDDDEDSKEEKIKQGTIRHSTRKETGESREKDKKTEKVRSRSWTPLKDGPRSAWSEPVDITSGGSSDDAALDQDSTRSDCDNEFDNVGFVPDETADLETLLSCLTKNAQTNKETLKKASKARDAMEKHFSDLHSEVERRRLQMLEAVEEYSKRLHRSVEDQSEIHRAEVNRSVGLLEETLQSMKDLIGKRNKLKSKHCKSLRQHIVGWDASCREAETVTSAVGWEQVTMKPPLGDQQEGIRAVMGALSTEADDDETNRLPSNQQSPKKKSSPGKKKLSTNLLQIPTLVKCFSCRMKKDKKTCGITDIAINDDGDIYVVDKHNKSVKMFDSNGVFQKLFNRDDVKKPMRVSYARSTKQVIVTDEETNALVTFTSDGIFLSQLICLQFPVSHCQLPDDRIAILEFATRSVVVCNPKGKIVHTFSTNMECPAYLTCTASNRIVVTDWKSASIKIFDATGHELFGYARTKCGPGDSTDHVDEPYGVCSDHLRNHIFVADRKKPGVILYSDGGEVVHCYTDSKHKVGIPFSIACHETAGLIAVAEYSGTVRLFKYTETSSKTDVATAAAAGS